MKIFDFKTSPILRLLSGRKKHSKEPEVSPEIIDGLRSLIRSKDWLLYKQLLDIFVSNQVKALLAGADDAEVHRLRGYVQGLLHSVQIPEQLVQQDDYSRSREQHAAGLAASRAESDNAALYATGYWGH